MNVIRVLDRGRQGITFYVFQLGSGAVILERESRCDWHFPLDLQCSLPLFFLISYYTAWFYSKRRAACIGAIEFCNGRVRSAIVKAGQQQGKILGWKDKTTVPALFLCSFCLMNADWRLFSPHFDVSLWRLCFIISLDIYFLFSSLLLFMAFVCILVLSSTIGIKVAQRTQTVFSNTFKRGWNHSFRSHIFSKAICSFLYHRNL